MRYFQSSEVSFSLSSTLKKQCVGIGLYLASLYACFGDVSPWSHLMMRLKSWGVFARSQKLERRCYYVSSGAEVLLESKSCSAMPRLD
jgi:hypothetical protein